jgi:tetratricopeptide (TPR) repeat protein
MRFKIQTLDNDPMKIVVSLFLSFTALLTTSAAFSQDVFQTNLNKSSVQRFKSAQSLRKAGRYQESIPVFIELVKQNPDYFLAWYNLGLAYTAKNDFNNGAKALEKAIQVQLRLLEGDRIKPEFTVYNTAAWALMQLNDYDKAERYLKVSYDNLDKLPSKDSQSRVLNNYGLLKMKQSDYEGAKKLFNAALALGNPIARDNLVALERLRKMKS